MKFNNTFINYLIIFILLSLFIYTDNSINKEISTESAIFHTDSVITTPTISEPEVDYVTPSNTIQKSYAQGLSWQSIDTSQLGLIYPFAVSDVDQDLLPEIITLTDLDGTSYDFGQPALTKLIEFNDTTKQFSDTRIETTTPVPNIYRPVNIFNNGTPYFIVERKVTTHLQEHNLVKFDSNNFYNISDVFTSEDSIYDHTEYDFDYDKQSEFFAVYGYYDGLWGRTEISQTGISTKSTTSFSPTGSRIFVADLDGDLEKELVVASYGGPITIYEYISGSDTFTATQTINYGTAPYVYTYDYDNDGLENIIIIYQPSTEINLVSYEWNSSSSQYIQDPDTYSFPGITKDGIVTYPIDIFGDGNQQSIITVGKGEARELGYMIYENNSFHYQTLISHPFGVVDALVSTPIQIDNDPETEFVISYINSSDSNKWWNQILDLAAHEQFLTIDEQFDHDVFSDTPSWSRTDTSISIDIPSELLKIGSDGGNDDYTDFLLPNDTKTIELRARLVSGGLDYLYPYLQLLDSSNEQAQHLYIHKNPSISVFGIGWIYETRIPRYEGIWWDVKFELTDSNCTMLIKSSVSALWTYLGTYRLYGEVAKLRIGQHWDSIIEVDYLKVWTISAPTPSISVGYDSSNQLWLNTSYLQWTVTNETDFIMTLGNQSTDLNYPYIWRNTGEYKLPNYYINTKVVNSQILFANSSYAKIFMRRLMHTTSYPDDDFYLDIVIHAWNDGVMKFDIAPNYSLGSPVANLYDIGHWFGIMPGGDVNNDQFYYPGLGSPSSFPYSSYDKIYPGDYSKCYNNYTFLTIYDQVATQGISMISDINYLHDRWSDIHYTEHLEVNDFSTRYFLFSNAYNGNSSFWLHFYEPESDATPYTPTESIIPLIDAREKALSCSQSPSVSVGYDSSNQLWINTTYVDWAIVNDSSFNMKIGSGSHEAKTVSYLWRNEGDYKYSDYYVSTDVLDSQILFSNETYAEVSIQRLMHTLSYPSNDFLMNLKVKIWDDGVIKLECTPDYTYTSPLANMYNYLNAFTILPGGDAANDYYYYPGAASAQAWPYSSYDQIYPGEYSTSYLNYTYLTVYDQNIDQGLAIIADENYLYDHWTDIQYTDHMGVNTYSYYMSHHWNTSVDVWMYLYEPETDSTPYSPVDDILPSIHLRDGGEVAVNDIPLIDSPSDVAFEEATTDHSITWNPTDNDPASYNITKDGILIKEGTWNISSQTITIDVSSLAVGSYTYRCTVIDESGQSAFDEVEVMVTDNPHPTIDSPVNIAYTYGDTGFTITWDPSDTDPDYYIVTRDGITVKANAWNNSLETITIDVSGLAVGNYIYRCTVNDSIGQIVYDEVQVTVSSNPIPIIDSPANVSYIYGDTGFSITWDPTDTDPDSYTITRNGVTIKTGLWNSSGETITINVDNLNIGVHTYRCTITDSLSQSIYDEVGVIVLENYPPFIDTPSNVTYTYGDTGKSIVWNPSDNDPNSYTITRNGVTIKTGLWNSSGETITIVIDGLPEGLYTYRCTVTDDLSQSTNNEVFVLVQSVEFPSIDSPDNLGYEVGSSGFSITWDPSDTDPASYTITCNEVLVRSNIWNNTFETISIDVTGLSVGTYTFKCTVFDEVGHSTFDEVLVIVSTNPPPTIDNPDDIYYTFGYTGNFINWSASDIHPTTYTISRDGVTLKSGLWNNSAEIISINVDGLTIGTYIYRCTVFDYSGQPTFDEVSVTVSDNPFPSINSPEDFNYTYSQIGHTITWSPSDNDPALYTITRNGEVIKDGFWNVTGETILINVDNLDVGSYTFICTVTDSIGQSKTDTVIVYVKNNPHPTITSPSDLTYIYGDNDNNIIWNPNDDDPATFIVTRNGTIIDFGPWNSSNELISVNIDSLTEGTYIYNCTVADSIGQTAFDEVWVTVSTNSPPSISSPPDITYEEGSIGYDITWTFTDTDPSTYTVTRNGITIKSGPWNSSGESITIDVDGLTANSYTYRCTIEDLIGQIKYDEVEVTVEVVSCVPSPPQILHGTSGDNLVTLIWTAPADSGSSDITIYKIYRSVYQGHYSLLVSTEFLSFKDASVSNGITYFYVVTAVNDAGESDYSNEITITPQQEDFTSTTATTEDTQDDLVSPGFSSVFLLIPLLLLAFKKKKTKERY